ncbi:MAG TPA: 30S ribosomal protein S6 [Longimicrobiaceae bacterium]|nr:30S ribosomal protein S6 [Longimicrobiaceae bacterium]
MRDYEVVYIFDSTLEEPQIQEKIERYHGLLTGPEGSAITAVDEWGRRELAYPIEDRDNGYYVVAHVTTEPEALPEFERILTLDEGLLRYLIVINEGDLQTSPAPEPEEKDEDDDSDDEED